MYSERHTEVVAWMDAIRNELDRLDAADAAGAVDHAAAAARLERARDALIRAFVSILAAHSPPPLPPDDDRGTAILFTSALLAGAVLAAATCGVLAWPVWC